MNQLSTLTPACELMRGSTRYPSARYIDNLKIWWKHISLLSKRCPYLCPGPPAAPTRPGKATGFALTAIIWIFLSGRNAIAAKPKPGSKINQPHFSSTTTKKTIDLCKWTSPLTTAMRRLATQTPRPTRRPSSPRRGQSRPLKKHRRNCQVCPLWWRNITQDRQLLWVPKDPSQACGGYQCVTSRTCWVHQGAVKISNSLRASSGWAMTTWRGW